MSAALQLDSNRRTSARFEVVLPVIAGTGPERCAGSSSNLSEGGACIELEGATPKVGASIEVQFAVPGTDETVVVEAEVRWAASTRCGVVFRRGHQRLVALLVAGVLSGAAGTANAAATTNVPTFDPNADIVMDMNAGGERPDSYTVTQAFARQYDAIDACVVESKGDSDRTLEGEAHIAVLLNPKGATPLGVNADLPSGSRPNAKPNANEARQLRECLRAAVATGNYPSYDGPPIVVEFDLELDPGFEEVPAE